MYKDQEKYLSETKYQRDKNAAFSEVPKHLSHGHRSL